MLRTKTVNHGLESLSYIDSKLWDDIPSHMKETLLMNLNMLLKLGNQICAHADAKFTYKILDIFSQQKKKKKKKRKYKYVYVKSKRHNCFFPFALRCTFPFLSLVIC